MSCAAGRRPMTGRAYAAWCTICILSTYYSAPASVRVLAREVTYARGAMAVWHIVKRLTAPRCSIGALVGVALVCLGACARHTPSPGANRGPATPKSVKLTVFCTVSPDPSGHGHVYEY